MATEKELEKQVNNLKKEFSKYEVSPNADGSYTVTGKRYSAKEFGAAKKLAKSNYDRVNKQYKELKEKQTRTSELAKSNVSNLKKELQTLQIENTRRAENISAQRGEGKFGGSQDVINRNNKRIKEIEKTLISLGSGPVQGPYRPEGTVVTPSTAGGFRQREGFVPGKPKVAEKPKTSVTPGGVTTQPGAAVEKTPAKPAVVVDWKPKFREMFAKQAWLLDLDPVKYAGLFNLLEKGVRDEMWSSSEGQARFAAELENTDFYVELKTKGTVRDITSLVGDLGFDTFPSFLKDAMNYGWEGETLKQKVYEEAFRKDPATGNYVNPTTIERVRKSVPYLDVAKIGRGYFSSVSDDAVSKVLTGQMTRDDVIRQQRELAKGKYGHLSSLLDQGLDLSEIADSYKTLASRVLEKDINSIDMSEAAYSTAFDFGEPGKKRLMSTSEWEMKLRSDPTFGWDKTQNAREEARTLATSISQAFGRII